MALIQQLLFFALFPFTTRTAPTSSGSGALSLRSHASTPIFGCFSSPRPPIKETDCDTLLQDLADIPGGSENQKWSPENLPPSYNIPSAPDCRVKVSTFGDIADNFSLTAVISAANGILDNCEQSGSGGLASVGPKGAFFVEVLGSAPPPPTPVVDRRGPSPQRQILERELNKRQTIDPSSNPEPVTNNRIVCLRWPHPQLDQIDCAFLFTHLLLEPGSASSVQRQGTLKPAVLYDDAAPRCMMRVTALPTESDFFSLRDVVSAGMEVFKNCKPQGRGGLSTIGPRKKFYLDVMATNHAQMAMSNSTSIFDDAPDAQESSVE